MLVCMFYVYQHIVCCVGADTLVSAVIVFAANLGLIVDMKEIDIVANEGVITTLDARNAIMRGK